MRSKVVGNVNQCSRHEPPCLHSPNEWIHFSFLSVNKVNRVFDLYRSQQAINQSYAISAGTLDEGAIRIGPSTIYQQYLPPLVHPQLLLCAFVPLPNPSLKQQIALALKPQTRLHKHFKRIALASESIDDIRARLDEWCFKHVAEQAEDRVERRKLGYIVARSGDLTVLDAREEFGEDHEVED